MKTHELITGVVITVTDVDDVRDLAVAAARQGLRRIYTVTHGKDQWYYSATHGKVGVWRAPKHTR